ncbi:MAG: ribonuclease T [Hyphomicrobiales bacterium]|nr:MAG: ribonuclease T [Hyphomicrobiales bacterium]
MFQIYSRIFSKVIAAQAFALVLIIAGIAPAAAQYSNRGGYQDYRSGRQSVPGVFDYYLLSLSWSPTYCAEQGDRGGGRDDEQCAPRSRPYAFVLHGLWPQYQRGWPQDCRSPDNGYVPKPVARRMLDVMPSERLVFHEYRKHGTCSGLGVDGYFDLARQLYERVRIPQRFVGLKDQRMFVSPDEVIQDFVRANPGLRPDMVAVSCGGPGNRLKEVRICFDKGGEFRSCGPNENQRRLCEASRMYVPPLREGGFSQPRRDRDEPEGPPEEIAPGPHERRL